MGGQTAPGADPAAVPLPDVSAVDLRRLLALVALTPSQAVHLAAQLCTALAGGQGADGPPERLTADRVVIDRDGGVRVLDPLARIDPAEPVADGSDGRGSAAVLWMLLRSADRPAARRRETDRRLLAELQHACTAAADDAAIGDLAVRLAASLRVNGRAADVVRGELTALLAAALPLRPAGPDDVARARTRKPLWHRPHPQARPSRPGAAVRPPAGPPPTPPTASPVRWHRPARHASAARTPLLVLATLVVLGGGYLVARTQIDSVANHLLHRQAATASETAGRSPAAQPTGTASRPPKRTVQARTPAPVPSLGPAAAAPINGVSVRALGPCRTGAACTVRVTISIAYAPVLQHSTWTLEAVDRCTGVRTQLAAGAMIAEPGWTDIYTSQTVRLPAAKALGLVALTNTPTRAASEPLKVPPTGASC